MSFSILRPPQALSDIVPYTQKMRNNVLLTEHCITTEQFRISSSKVSSSCHLPVCLHREMRWTNRPTELPRPLSSPSSQKAAKLKVSTFSLRWHCKRPGRILPHAISISPPSCGLPPTPSAKPPSPTALGKAKGVGLGLDDLGIQS